MTTNDYALDVYNGEIGVVVRQGARRRVFIAGAGAGAAARLRAQAGSMPSRPCTR